MGEILPRVLLRLRSASCRARPSLLALPLPLLIAMVGCSSALPWRVARISNRADENGLPLVAGSAVPPNEAEPNNTSYVNNASYVNTRPPLTPPAPAGIAAPTSTPASLPRQWPQTGIRQVSQVEEKSQTLPTPRTLPENAAVAFTFDQAINFALAADPRIRAGFEVINQANADFKTSSLLPNPTLLTDILTLPLQNLDPVNFGGPPQMDVQLSFPIDFWLFRKRRAAMDSARAAVEVSEAGFADLVRQRVRDTAVAFYDVVEAKALLDLARQNVENLHRVQAATSKAVEAGGRPLVDLNRVRLDVLRSEQDMREAETTLVVAKANLRAKLGQRDADRGFDVIANLDAELTAKPLPVSEALDLAERDRPDIWSLKWQIEKARRDTRTEKTKAFPQVTPMIGYTHQFQVIIGAPDANTWDASLTMTLPFFDRNQGNRAKAQSVMVQNLFNLEAGLVDLRAEIVQVSREFETAYKNAGAVAEEQVRLAREVRDSIETAFQNGGRTLLEVLDAEREYRDTYRSYISNRANYWRSAYKFNAAIGQQVLQQ
jgi:cobalt-zinc-cadmium efflux system outer membrane protein